MGYVSFKVKKCLICREGRGGKVFFFLYKGSCSGRKEVSTIFYLPTKTSTLIYNSFVEVTG